MMIKIQNKKLNPNKHNNIVLFTNSNSDVKGLNNSPIKQIVRSIKKSINLNKNNIKDFYSFDLTHQIKIIVVKITKDNNLFNYYEKLGANFLDFVKSNSLQENLFIDTNLKHYSQSNNNFFNEFLYGLLIKSYVFDKYKSKKIKRYFKLIFMEILD